MKIGILTSGGDCPGLNAVIRGAVLKGIKEYEDIEFVGFRDGWRGVVDGDIMDLPRSRVRGISKQGGTILGTSRTNPFEGPNGGPEKIKATLKRLGIDAVIAIGGEGTLAAAQRLTDAGLQIVGVPKTVDNDLDATDYTFGFDTAISVATDGLDRVRTTGMSHHRIMVVEIMGRGAGWMTLHAGIAGAADAILIPEIPYDINKVADKIKADKANGKEFSIVACSEGAKSLDGKQVVSKIIEDSADSIRLGGVGAVVAEQLEKLTGSEARATTLGHIQRGGTPTAHDRVLSSRYGYAAVELCMKGEFGKMVTLQGDTMGAISLEDVIGQKTKNVDPNGELVTLAKAMGVCFGD